MLEEYEVANNKQNIQAKELNKRYYELQKRFTIGEKERKELVQKMINAEKEKKAATERWIRATAQLKQGEKHVKVHNASRMSGDVSKGGDLESTRDDSRIQNLSREIEQLKSVLDLKEETILNQAETIKKIHKDFASKTAEIVSLSSQTKELYATLDETTQQLNLLQNENQELSANLRIISEKAKEFDHVFSELKALKKAHEELLARYQAEQKSLQIAQNLADSFKSEVKRSENALVQEKTKTARLEAEVKRRDGDKNSAERDVNVSEEKRVFETGLKELAALFCGVDTSGECSKKDCRGKDEIRRKTVLALMEKSVDKLISEKLKSDEKYDRLLRKYFNICEGGHKHVQSMPETSSVMEDASRNITENATFSTEKENMPLAVNNNRTIDAPQKPIQPAMFMPRPIPVIMRNMIAMRSSNNRSDFNSAKSPTGNVDSIFCSTIIADKPEIVDLSGFA